MSAHYHVVIPTHNRVALLEKCLDCLARQDDDGFSVIVVNDGSNDGTSERLKERFPQVEVIEGDGNLWWAGAVEKAIQAVLNRLSSQPERMASDAIVLVNDDTELDAGFIATLRDISSANPDTLIGSVVLDISDRSTIIRGGVHINWWTAKMKQINYRQKIEAFDDDFSLEVSTLSGRGVLVPLAVFPRAGSFNVAHFPQNGDLEFPVRAARAGFRLRTFYRSKVYCHFDLHGDVNTNKTYGLFDVKTLLFDRRSYLNLRLHFWLAYDTARNPLQFVVFLVCDLARVTKSVLQKLLQHYMRKR